LSGRNKFRIIGSGEKREESGSNPGMSVIQKISFVFVAAAALVSAIPAGVLSGPRIGVMGGLARYSFSGDAADKAAYRTLNRGAAGAIIELDIHSGVRLSIQPSYVQKGTGIAYEVLGQKERVDSVEVKTDYLSIPVMVRILTGSERWFVSGGLELAWLLDARYETSTGDNDIKDRVDDLDFAIQFGAGWIKPVGRHELFLEVRYTQSILNVISAKDSREELSGLRLKNSGILFCAGFLFDLQE